MLAAAAIKSTNHPVVAVAQKQIPPKVSSSMPNLRRKKSAANQKRCHSPDTDLSSSISSDSSDSYSDDDTYLGSEIDDPDAVYSKTTDENVAHKTQIDNVDAEVVADVVLLDSIPLVDNLPGTYLFFYFLQN